MWTQELVEIHLGAALPISCPRIYNQNSFTLPHHCAFRKSKETILNTDYFPTVQKNQYLTSFYEN